MHRRAASVQSHRGLEKNPETELPLPSILTSATTRCSCYEMREGLKMSSVIAYQGIAKPICSQFQYISPREKNLFTRVYICVYVCVCIDFTYAVLRKVPVYFGHKD